jgi:hypothetical protein
MGWIGIAQDLVADGLIPTPADEALGLPKVGQGAQATVTSTAPPARSIVSAATHVGKVPTRPRPGGRFALVILGGIAVVLAAWYSAGPRSRPASTVAVPEPVLRPSAPAPEPARPTVAPAPRANAPTPDRTGGVRRRKAVRAAADRTPATDGTEVPPHPPQPSSTPDQPSPEPSAAPSSPGESPPRRTLDLQQVRNFERNL